jgi:hypothetical protein
MEVLFRIQWWKKPLIIGEAKAMRWLPSGLTQARPVAFDTRLPASYGPEVSHRTSSALHQCGGQWFLTGYRGVLQNLKSLRFLRMFGLTTSERCTSFDVELGVCMVFPGPCETGVEQKLCKTETGRSCASMHPRHTVHPEHKSWEDHTHPQRPHPCRF